MSGAAALNRSVLAAALISATIAGTLVLAAPAGPAAAGDTPRTPEGGSSGPGAGGVTAAAPSPSDARAALRLVVPGLLAQYHVPGLAVTVVRARHVGWTECFGVKRAGEAVPITAETVFEAASLSKPVVAYLAMREVERGALALDKPLAQYLDQPYMADPRGARITARQVLSHTGGLPNWARGKPLAVETEPGARWRYSGEGYVYLQRVLERVSGQPLAELAHQMVLAPLGMAASSFVWRADYERTSAAPHDRAGRPAAKEKPAQANAAASLHCTAPDYARFLAAMLDPAAHRDLLPPAALGAMLVPAVEVDPKLGLSWGLGWGLESWNGSRCFFHWGSNDGFRCFVLGNPANGDGLVVMTDGASGLDLIEELVRTLEGKSHPLFRFPLLHPQD
jgi:CubicO group peptidase (beta-lactamase class C family)